MEFNGNGAAPPDPVQEDRFIAKVIFGFERRRWKRMNDPFGFIRELRWEIGGRKRP